MENFSLILDYSFQAVKRNWPAVLIYLVLLMAISHFFLIPIFSPIAHVIVEIVGFQILVYYGRPILQRLSKEELYAFLSSSTVGKIYTEKIEVSSGIFLASHIISLVFVLFFVLLVLAVGLPVTGEIINEITSQELIAKFLVKSFIVFLVFALAVGWFLYVYPIVLGYAMGKEDFGEAFLAVFKVFSPEFWKRALSFNYFVFISVSGIFTAVLSLFAIFFMATVVLFPIGVAIFYMLNVFFGALCAESYLMTGGELPPKRGGVIDEQRSLS